MDPTIRKLLSTLAACALCATSQHLQGADLLAYFDFNDNSNPAEAVELSGNAPNAAMANGAVHSTDGGGVTGEAGDRALDLGAAGNASAVLPVGTHFDAAAASDQMTVTFWQFNNGFSNSSSIWVNSPAANANFRGFQAHAPWGSGQVFFDTAGCCATPSQRLTPGGTAATGQWQHWAFVKNGGVKEIWIDGVLTASQASGAAPLLPFDGVMTIGAEFNSTNGLNGFIDDVAVFDGALTETEIACLADGSITPAAFLPLTLVDGLVNYWDLDSNLQDWAPSISGSASTVADDGTFAGANGTGGISFAPGLFGQATSQDGAAGPAQNNGYVDIPRSGDTLFGATTAHTPNQVTTSVWVNSAGFDTAWQAVIAHGEGAQYRIARRGNTNFAGYAGGTGEGPQGANPMAPGWHHIVAISDGAAGQTRLYVDGVLDSTGGNPNINDGQGGGTLNLNIGANPNTGGQNREWNGLLDDVAQWNRALSEQEIATLWGGGPGSAQSLKALISPSIAIYCGSKGPSNKYWQDFEFPDGTTVLGDGSQMNGTANIQGGQLELTRDGVAGGFASFNIPGLECASNGWTATFDLTIIDGPGANPPADGMSFNWGNFGLAELGSAEEGMAAVGGVTENLSFEIDTWMNFDGEQGVNIAQKVGGADQNLSFTNGPILADGTTVSGQVTASWDPVNGASYSTTGLLTNATFANVPTAFVASDAHLFGLSGRVGGANETKLIDNLHIETFGDPLVVNGDSTPIDFGSTCPGTPLCKDFTIVNSGNAALVFTGLPTLPADWSIVGSPPASIPPGCKATIKLQFDATGPGGTVGGTVSVPTNDSDNNPYTFVVTAFMDATAPVISGTKDIVANAPAEGTVMVTYPDITAEDDVDGTVAVVCTPDDTFAFPVGVTTVTCTATDACGNVGMATFDVIVLAIQPSLAERVLDSVSLRGDAAPGPAPGTSGGIPAGATLNSFSNAYLNNSAEVLLQANLSSAGTNNAGVFSNASGAFESLGVKNTASPAGSDYLSFRDLALADDGVASFKARTTVGDAHVTSSGSAVTLLVGSPPPTLAGAPIVRSLAQPALSGGAELFSPVGLLRNSGSPPTVTSQSDTLIWSAATGLVAREGDTAADLPVGVEYGHLFGRVVANDVPEIAFAGNLKNAGSGSAALWSGDPGSLTVVAQRGNVAPGTGGAQFGSFLAESISPAGTVVFRSSLKLSDDVDSSNNEALFTDRSGSLALVAREGSPAPCAPGAEFDRFSSLFIDSSGSIVFFAFLKGEGINSANDGSIWRSDPSGGLHLIAREGDAANSIEGGIFAQIDVVAINDTGGVLIQGRLLTGLGDVTSVNRTGLWRASNGGDPAPELVLRRGDTIEIGEVERRISGLSVSYVDNSAGGTGGYGRIMNDNGEAVITVDLDGGVTGVFLIPSLLAE